MSGVPLPCPPVVASEHLGRRELIYYDMTIALRRVRDRLEVL